MKKIIFGMPCLVEFDTIGENVELCKELGLDFIELNMNLPQFQPDKIDVNRLLDIQKTQGIFFTFHLPEELDIANFNSKIRRAHLEIVGEAIEISKALKCPVLNMHMNSGVYFTMPDSKIYLYRKYFDDFYKSVLDFGAYADEIIGGDNISLCIENTGIYNRDYILKAVSELLKRECFALTWDIGHDYSSGNIDANFIMNNADKLKHMHLHDGIGKSNHLPLFSGEIDVLGKLNIAQKTKSTCVLETKTVDGLKKSVSELIKLGYFFKA